MTTKKDLELLIETKNNDLYKLKNEMSDKLNTAANTISGLRKEISDKNDKIRKLEMKDNRAMNTIENYLKQINTLLTKITFIIDSGIVNDNDLKLPIAIRTELQDIKRNLDEYYY